MGRWTLVVILVVLIAFVSVSVNEYFLDRQRILDHINIELNHQSISINNWFNRISSELDMVIEFAMIDIPANPASVPLLEELQPAVADRLGLPAPDNRIGESYGNIIVGSEIETDPLLAEKTAIATRLLEYLAPIYQHDSALQQTYFISHDEPLAGIFPYQGLNELGPRQADGTFEWERHSQLHSLLDESFATDQPQWLGPWIPAEDHPVTVSYLNFIKLDDGIVGTLESELKPGIITELLGSKLLPECKVLVVDTEGNVLAASANIHLPDDRLTTVNSLLPADQARNLIENLEQKTGPREFETRKFNIQTFPLPSTPWMLVALAPNSALAATLKPQLINYFTQLAIIFLGLLFVYFYVRTRYVKPFARAELALADSHATLEARVAERTQELECLNEEIRATNEELASTNEELIASNEELAATNEELNSANEEIIATSEELSSTNEELAQAYQQLSSAMDQVRDSENRLRAIFTRSAIPTIIVTSDLKISEANDAFCRWLGYSLEEACQFTIPELIHPDDREEAKLIAPQLLSCAVEQLTYERRYRAKDGRYFWAHVNTVVVQDASGQFAFVISQSYDITEQRLAEEALVESNERFRKAFHSSPDSITISRADTGEFIEVNEGFLKMIGCTLEEAVGTRSLDLDIWTPADRQRLLKMLQADGRVRNEEFTFRSKSGQPINGLMSAEFITLGGEQCLVAVVRDVTELRRSEQNITRFFSLTSGLIMIADFDGRIVQATQAWEAVTGCPLSEFIGSKFIDYVHPDDREATQTAAATLTEGKRVVNFKNRYLHRDGSTHIIEWSSVASVKDELVFAMAHDSSELIHAMDALRASGEQFRAYFELGLTPMAFIDMDGRWLQVNEQLALLTGYLQDELREMSVLDMLPSSQVREVQNELDLIADGAQDKFSMELEFSPRTGSTRIVIFSARARRDNRGQISYLLAQLHDITAAKQAESDLRRLTTAIHQASEYITITSPDYRAEYANPAFLNLTGLSEDEVVGRRWQDIGCIQMTPREFAEIEQKLESGDSWHGDMVHKTVDGELVHTTVTITPVSDEQGRMTSFVAIGRDMTQQRRWEQRLRQSQKLEAIGTLAGGIAHDFNNILFAMLGNTEMALEHLPENNQAVYCLEEVQKAGLRARDLIRQILSFARRSDAQPRKLQIGDIVDEVAKLMRSSLPSTIEIQVQLNVPDLVVHADPTQIHQVLMNLSTNAGQAMEQTGGVLTFELNRYDHVTGEQTGLNLQPGGYLLLKISDTGPGIPPDILSRIFEPFFTTKEQGQGTGMGLSVVHGVVTELHGAITVENKPGGGAEFSVYLPLADGHVIQEVPDRANLPRGSEKILLVDDEEPIVSMLKEILAKLGYTAVPYDSSIEAWQAFKAAPYDFDLLFTDQTMPRMTGVELALRCREVRPELPVVVCTGYNPEGLEPSLPVDGSTLFLTKPLSRAPLAHAIRNVLDHTSDLKDPPAKPQN